MKTLLAVLVLATLASAQINNPSSAPAGSDVTTLGAQCDGTTDDHVALQAAFTGAAGGIVIVPPNRVCATSVTITLPASTNLRLDGTIKATSAISGNAVIATDTAAATIDPQIYGVGTIDANNLADYGLWLTRFQDANVHDIHVNSALVYGIRLGDTPLGITSYGARVHSTYISRTSGTVPANSVGIWLDNASDNRFIAGNRITGYQKGILVNTGQNSFIDNHVWNVTPSDLTIAFEDASTGNEWIGDYADTPATDCWHLTSAALNTRIIGGKCYNNSSGTNGVLVGVQIDSSSTQPTVMGVHFFGSDASHAILTDIVCPTSCFGSPAQVVGGYNQTTNVTNKNSTTANAINVNVPGNLNVLGQVLLSATAPTISSGFGTSPSVTNNHGTGAFTVNVGTGGVATTGIVGLPTAQHGWTCTCEDITTNSATVFRCKQTGVGTTTTAPLGEFTAAGAAQAWTASDVLTVSCHAY